MDFIKKPDDNMTIWQFDDAMQHAVNQVITIEIVKLPNCHGKIFDDADSSSRERTTIRQKYGKDRKKV